MIQYMTSKGRVCSVERVYTIVDYVPETLENIEYCVMGVSHGDYFEVESVMLEVFQDVEDAVLFDHMLSEKLQEKRTCCTKVTFGEIERCIHE